jgi:hypothetical protein
VALFARVAGACSGQGRRAGRTQQYRQLASLRILARGVHSVTGEKVFDLSASERALRLQGGTDNSDGIVADVADDAELLATPPGRPNTGLSNASSHRTSSAW